MDKLWTLHVENFGKIAEADVSISPLMCFVGDNNSGKSYLMSLLWGVLTLGKDIFPKMPSEAKTYKRCENWLRESLNKNRELTEEDLDMYVSWFNELLYKKKKNLLIMWKLKKLKLRIISETTKLKLNGKIMQKDTQLHRHI